MNKKFFAVSALAAALFVAGLSTETVHAQAACTTIQSGTILYQPGNYLEGTPITTGVNPYGYNYQAHSYAGNYFNAYAAGADFPPYDGDDTAYLLANPGADAHWAWQYRDDQVAMKWNDAWLSNKDCDGDGKLDRHQGFTSYVGSGAWLTNHNSWDVGNNANANDFIKIVAMPVGAVVDTTVGFFGEGTVLVNGVVAGDRIWGEFFVPQYVLNDPSNGDHGVRLLGQVKAGFGGW